MRNPFYSLCSPKGTVMIVVIFFMLATSFLLLAAMRMIYIAARDGMPSTILITENPETGREVMTYILPGTPVPPGFLLVTPTPSVPVGNEPPSATQSGSLSLEKKKFRSEPTPNAQRESHFKD